MKIVFGMIIGALLTAAAVFAYDSISGRAQNGLQRATADERLPIVNWGVVGEDLRQLALNLEALGEDIQRSWRKPQG